MVKRKLHTFKVAGSTPVITSFLIFLKNYQFLPKPSRLSFTTYWLAFYRRPIARNFFFLTYTSTDAIKLHRPTTSNYYNLYFLKKEYFYTKLKYSRVPQFDTSSGAVASLLSGFYGFAVCEKFGFELLDSADFLFSVLYIVLASFVVTAFLKIIEGDYDLRFFISYWFRSFW